MTESAAETLCVRQVRIVHFAILLATLMFGVVAVVLRREGLLDGFSSDDGQIIGWVAAGSAVVFVPTAFAIRAVFFRRLREIESDSEAGNQYRAAHILFLALLEGGAMFNIVASILCEPPLNWAVAGAIWALMAATWPTAQAFENLRRDR